jgi:sigma-B regulation protein RsbU (phosphoserine phosphatase)
MAGTQPIIRESQFAREVQDRIFPSTHPSIPHLDYFGDWRHAHGVSRDYLDYFELSDGSFCLAIGDVAGQGLDAAMLTVSLHGIVRALRSAHSGKLVDFVSMVDETFRGVAPSPCHATLLVCRYDPYSRLLEYVNAGHEPPFLLRRNRVIRLASGGPVIGMLRRPPFRERTIALDPGDLLVAHTDGLYDAASPRGDEWGWGRLVETVRHHDHLRARDVVARVFDAIDAFTGGAPQPDDMTLWVARVAETEYKLRPQLAECEELVAA